MQVSGRSGAPSRNLHLPAALEDFVRDHPFSFDASGVRVACSRRQDESSNRLPPSEGSIPQDELEASSERNSLRGAGVDFEDLEIDREIAKRGIAGERAAEGGAARGDD